MNYVLTLIANTANVRMDETVVRDLAALLQVRHHCQTSCHKLATWKAWDIQLNLATEEAAVIATVQEVMGNLEIDYILQPLANRRKKLLISDMDSTMINQECIDEIADYAGLKAQIAEITDRAMNGELDFQASLRARVALLTGLSESFLLKALQEKITYMSGARTLVQTMRKHGAFCILVSGGFTFFASRIAEGLGFHRYDANILEIKDSKLTGTVQEPILDKDSKKSLLEHYAKEQHIALPDTLAVGDGANDLPMLLAAGLGIAYHAKPHVKAQAKAKIEFTDLTSLLYAQGYTSEQFVID